MSSSFPCLADGYGSQLALDDNPTRSLETPAEIRYFNPPGEKFRVRSRRSPTRYAVLESATKVEAYPKEK